ncbi:MAG: 16S rRNA (adenine(1518)-N(6)/adenine(1519)-N(6))-dimethyltransferase RsmA [Patescibacteria group bacterium]
MPSLFSGPLRRSAKGRGARALGQNFLTDERIANRILDAASISPTDTVLEIGPGRGALTEKLVERASRVVAVEVDKKLIRELQEKFGGARNLEIIHGDALRVPAGELRLPSKFKLVANLPYASGAAILRRFLEEGPRPEVAVVMLQREVAERIAAKPPHSTLLTIAVQLFGKPKILFRVPPSAFSPQPKVESAVIEIRVPERSELLRNLDVAKFFTILKAGFSAPRKKLHNNLKKFVSSERLGELLKHLGVSSDARPAEISVEDWTAIARALA